MDLNYSADDLAFRDEVRGFLARALPDDMRERVRRGDDSRVREDGLGWQRILHAQGWGAPMWPTEFGGTGWSLTRQSIFESECAEAYAPEQLPFGLKMVAPVIMRFGTPAQQQRFLPGIIEGRDWWCQGYSEPGAGSDLASLKMRAEHDGDHYVLNGQKVWNTLGQHADWIFCLVRTDPEAKAQRGISFILVDMKTPGIRIRPTRLLEGSHEVNEIWFDSVRVPTENLVGEENQGWTYAKFLLGHERTNIAGIGLIRRELRRLRERAAQQVRRGRALLDDPGFAARLAAAEIELRALEITHLRVIFDHERQRAPGPEASVLKIRGTELAQRVSELRLEAFGRDALGLSVQSEGAQAATRYLNLRKLSIYGGSNEIQRNIIARQILGL